MLHNLYDFVCPRTERGVWRVVEVSPDRVTAEERPNELEPKTVRRVVASHDFFISLEEPEK